MANQNVNKVVIGGVVKIDLTGDTVSPDKLAEGITAHDKSGASIIGTSTFNADTTDSTVDVSEVLEGEVFHTANGDSAVGTMPNRGADGGTISSKDEEFTIKNGYHDGSGKVSINTTEKAKLIPENIRQGVTVLGVEGSMKPGDGVIAQSKTVKPNFTTQSVLPDPGYTHLSQVDVEPIPVAYTDNAQGGQTLSVG